MNTDFDPATLLEALFELWKASNRQDEPPSSAGSAAMERLVRAIKQMDHENRELRLRVAALTRLLITQGVFSADDFAVSVAEMKSIVATSPSAMARGNHAGHQRIAL